MATPLLHVGDVIAADLDRQGWSVQRDFLAPPAAAALHDRALAWWRDGEFRPAYVGRGPSRRLDESVRTDHVRWLDFATGGRFRDVYDTWYEPLRQALNRRLYLGLFDFEAHVTMYPPGSFYVRHLDRFRDAPHRAVTAILYLNPAWTPDDGGALRLHLPGPDGGEIPHDVVPQAGTLVTFLSAEIPHEVLPTRRERLSFTGWFCTRR
ncbi:2OG-Fe(II) oxygenase [bacterium]|nr:2OG-Fe(II) oxygenase [bacterium]